MSSKSDTNAVSTNGDKGDKTVIRYSQEFLLACAKSPLVERPAALPPNSVWFGYDFGSIVLADVHSTQCQAPRELTLFFLSNSEIVKEEQEFNNSTRRNNSRYDLSLVSNRSNSDWRCPHL